MGRRNFDLIKKNLISLGYIVNCFETASEATSYINSKIDNQTVGFAGSMTLEKMGLFEKLSTHNQVFWHHIKLFGMRRIMVLRFIILPMTA